MYMDDIKHFAKNEKRIGNPRSNWENIQSKYRNGIWQGKCTMLIVKRIKEAVELRNQIVIRNLREKETYKYLGILEADTIK